RLLWPRNGLSSPEGPRDIPLLKSHMSSKSSLIKPTRICSTGTKHKVLLKNDSAQPILLEVSDQPNLAKLQEELLFLREKMKRHELSRLDVQRILHLEWLVHGTWDELDNYDQYLAPGAKEFLHEKRPPAGAQ